MTHAILVTRPFAADWVLFARGFTYDNATNNVQKSGADLAHPMLYSNFDPTQTHTVNVAPTPNPAMSSARPILWQTGTNPPPCFSTTQSNWKFNAFVGLDCYAHTRDPNNASFNYTDAQRGVTQLTGGWNGILFEDTRARYGPQTGLLVPTDNYAQPLSDVYFRRNVQDHGYPAPLSGTSFAGFQIGAVTNGPSGYVVFENTFDHNSWATETGKIPWANPNGFSHNIYLNEITSHGDSVNNTVPEVVGNILANDGSSSSVRTGGVNNNNLYFQVPFNWGLGTLANFAHSWSGNVIVNATRSVATGVTALSTGGGGFDGWPALGSITVNNNFLVNSPDDLNAAGLQLAWDGNFNVTSASAGVGSVTGNTAFNYGLQTAASANYCTNGLTNQSTTTNITGQAIAIYFCGSIDIGTITTQGAGYVDNKVVLSGVAANVATPSTGAPWVNSGYVTLHVPGIQTSTNQLSSWGIVDLGSGPGNVIATEIDSASIDYITLIGVPCNAGNNCPGTINGALYFPYPNVPVTCVTCANGAGGAHGAQGALLDLISVNGHIAGYEKAGSDFVTGSMPGNSGLGYTVGDVLTAAQGTPCGGASHINCTNGFGGASGVTTNFQFTVGTVGVVNIGANGCNLASGNNNFDYLGTNPNGCTYTGLDLGRTIGAYYALGGTTASLPFPSQPGWTVSPAGTFNATTAGASCSSGGNTCIMTVTGTPTATLRKGDALSLGSKSDYILGSGAGAIATLGNLSATPCSTFPSGCSANVFTGAAIACVTCSNGAATGGTATVSVDNSTVTGFAYTGGTTSNYNVGDSLTVAPSSIGGSGTAPNANTNFTIPVSAIINGGLALGSTTALTIIASNCSTGASPGCALGSYPNVPINCGGASSGALATITVTTVGAGPQITGYNVTTSGTNYNNVVNCTVPPTSVGGSGASPATNATLQTKSSAIINGSIQTLGSPTVSQCVTAPAGSVGCTANASHTYTGVHLVGGTGNAILYPFADVTVTNGAVSNVVISSTGCSTNNSNNPCGGRGYVVGDLLTAMPVSYSNPSTGGIGGVSQSPAPPATCTGDVCWGNPNFTIQSLTFDNTVTNGASLCSGSPCTGNGGAGTYLVSGFNPAISTSTVINLYKGNQLINLMDAQFKGNWTNNLTACAVNRWIKAGFGVTDTCTP